MHQEDGRIAELGTKHNAPCEVAKQVERKARRTFQQHGPKGQKSALNASLIRTSPVNCKILRFSSFHFPCFLKGVETIDTAYRLMTQCLSV
jgi:hypothetical protein